MKNNKRTTHLKYIKYVTDDVIKSMKFNNRYMGHMAMLHGEQINTCNLHSWYYEKILIKSYGCTTDECYLIFASVKEYLDETKPGRCF